MTKLCTSTCLLLAVFFKTAAAQTPDTLLYKQALYTTINKFDKGIGEQARLYNGYVYTGYNDNVTGNAFLDDVTSWSSGSVEYDGETFENVPMNYDIYQDQLIVLFGNNLPCSLIKSKVASFVIRNIQFVNVPPGNNIKAGYYAEPYSGISEVLNKIEKNLKSDIKSTSVERYFAPVEDYQQYYIKKNDKYVKVSTIGDILSVFGDKKKELRAYIKSRNIQSDGPFKYNLTELAKYYDSLNK